MLQTSATEPAKGASQSAAEAQVVPLRQGRRRAFTGLFRRRASSAAPQPTQDAAARHFQEGDFEARVAQQQARAVVGVHHEALGPVRPPQPPAEQVGKEGLAVPAAQPRVGAEEAVAGRRGSRSH